MLSLNDADKAELKRVFARLKARAAKDNAGAEAVAALKAEIATVFDQNFAAEAPKEGEGAPAPDGDKWAEHFNKERDSRPSPFAPAK